jgi:hypothetical protein
MEAARECSGCVLVEINENPLSEFLEAEAELIRVRAASLNERTEAVKTATRKLRAAMNKASTRLSEALYLFITHKELLPEEIATLERFKGELREMPIDGFDRMRVILYETHRIVFRRR